MHPLRGAERAPHPVAPGAVAFPADRPAGLVGPVAADGHQVGEGQVEGGAEGGGVDAPVAALIVGGVEGPAARPADTHSIPRKSLNPNTTTGSPTCDRRTFPSFNPSRFQAITVIHGINGKSALAVCPFASASSG